MPGNNKFDPDKDIPDLSGKVYVVTGGSAGIGYGICAHLLQHNCEALYLLGKKQDHLASATENLKSWGDTTKLHPVQVDFEDLHQTSTVAQTLASQLPRLDALILNAGLGVGPYAESRDGIDTHMQVNVLAQHHLTMHLLPSLCSTPNSRLILQSSEFHRFAPSNTTFASLSSLNTDIGPMALYGRTKLAQILLVRAFCRRKQQNLLGMTSSRPPVFLATHPGGVVTDQQDQAVEAYGTLGKIGVKAVRPFMKDAVDEGCRPVLFAATSEEALSLDGAYIVPDRKVSDVSKQAQDDELGEQLWRLTEEILTDKLGNLPYATSYGS